MNLMNMLFALVALFCQATASQLPRTVDTTVPPVQSGDALQQQASRSDVAAANASGPNSASAGNSPNENTADTSKTPGWFLESLESLGDHFVPFYDTSRHELAESTVLEYML